MQEAHFLKSTFEGRRYFQPSLKQKQWDRAMSVLSDYRYDFYESLFIQRHKRCVSNKNGLAQNLKLFNETRMSQPV